MNDIQLVGLVVLVTVLVILPADLALLWGGRGAVVKPSSPAFDWRCRCEKSSAECPERNGGVCDG